MDLVRVVIIGEIRMGLVRVVIVGEISQITVMIGNPMFLDLAQCQ
jgi:hypothetical protein